MRDRAWLLAAVVAVVLAPFAIFRFVPSCDFPNHAAIASVLVRLWHGDPAVTQYFAPNLTSTPYYLFYFVAVPLVALLGPVVGAKLATAALAATFLAGAWLVLAERNRPLWVLLLAPLFVYNVSFFYGFMASFAGLGPLLIGYWALLRSTSDPRRRWLVVATVAGLLAVSAHILLVAAWAAVIAGYLLGAPRERWKRALAVGCLSMTPAAPFVIGLLAGPTGAPVPLGRLYHNSFDYLKKQFQLFDRGVGRGAMYSALVLVVATFGARVVERWRAHQSVIAAQDRTVLTVLAALMVAYFVVPVEWPSGEGWGLSFRYFPLVGVAFLAAVPTLPRRSVRRVQTVAAAAILVAYLGALWSFWGRFDAATRDFDSIRACMDRGRTVLVRAEQERFLTAWPPVGLHTHAYYLAVDGAYDTAAFAGAHLPIRVISTPSRPDGIEGFDYLLVQGERARMEPAPANARLLREAGMWRLYAPAGESGRCGDEPIGSELQGAAGQRPPRR